MPARLRYRCALNPSPSDVSTLSVRNIFACLVHEKPDCIVDLVHNLQCHDPDSIILLYNGGEDPRLLDAVRQAVAVGPARVVVHPRPRSMQWGWLHDFALDCMRFAEELGPYDTITIVESDQLAVGKGYSQRLGAALKDKQGIGMLGNAPYPQECGATVPPAYTAQQEHDLWRPFLRRFHEEETRFVYWTLWPSTVFTAEAARALVRFYDTDRQLKDLLQHTRIWASEEILLPTLTVLLGFRIQAHPCSYRYVSYSVRYTDDDVRAALRDPDVYWIHPIPRQLDHPLRLHIRETCR